MPRPPAPALPAAALCLALAGCTPAPPGVDVWDPFEARNREVHAENAAIDRMFLSGGAGLYGTVVPEPVRLGISNVAANAGAPSDALNSLLQGRVDRTVTHVFRFLINTTVGIGGLFDAAGALGIEARRTDFGETLFVWGAPEGAYLELPILGPSTERDAAGMVIGILIDPLNHISPAPRRNRLAVVRSGAVALSRIGDREAYSEAYDALLAESPDSYALARSIYLQYRRFTIGDLRDEEAFDPFDEFDPFEEF